MDKFNEEMNKHDKAIRRHKRISRILELSIVAVAAALTAIIIAYKTI